MAVGDLHLPADRVPARVVPGCRRRLRSSTHVQESTVTDAPTSCGSAIDRYIYIVCMHTEMCGVYVLVM